MSKVRNKSIQKAGVVFLFFILILTSFAVGACVEAPNEAATDSETYPVDPTFREYYEYLGGRDVLGPPISPAFHEGNSIYQYMENCKMVYNPEAEIMYRFSLAPLGRDMNVVEPPVPTPSQPGVVYIEGHTIHPDFLPLYEKFGALNVGLPLTEIRYNPARKRYEQFFENLGMYRIEGSDEVRLLAYGAWACDHRCRAGEVGNYAIMDIQSHIDPTFSPYVSRLGTDFTGFALSEAYRGADGKWEQIMENVVLVTEAANDSAHITIRPLPELLKISHEPAKPHSGAPNMYFYSLGGDMGYEIPDYFWDYIVRHGGLEVTGPPISHLAPLNELALHQCYTHLCLMYDFRASEGARVRVEPLGYAYKLLYYHANKKEETLQPPMVNETILQTWKKEPLVASSQLQEIGVIWWENLVPVANSNPELTIFLPDGSKQDYVLPPTGSDGRSSMYLPPISVPNGSVIVYKVCIQKSAQDKFCVRESFIIWNNP